VIPDDDSFPFDARLPIGWKVPGCGLIVGTGEKIAEEVQASAYTNKIEGGGESGGEEVAFKEGDSVGVLVCFATKTLEFTMNGRSLGVAFGLPQGKFRVAVSLVQTQRVTLKGDTRPAGNADKKISPRTQTDEEDVFFSLAWQVETIKRTGASVLYWNDTTERFMAADADAEAAAAAALREKQQKQWEKLEAERKALQEARGRISGDREPDKQNEAVLQVKQLESELGIEPQEAVAKQGVLSLSTDLLTMARERAKLAREKAKAEESQLMLQSVINEKAKAARQFEAKAKIELAEQKRPLLILDLPNICMAHGRNKVFSCAGVQRCISFWRKQGFKKIVAFVPAHLLDFKHVGMHRNLVRLGLETEKSTKTKIPDNISLLVSLADEGYIVATPPQDYDDSYCISYANKHGGYVVTNDQYRDCTQVGVSRDWLRTHLITFTFVNDEFVPNPDFRFFKENQRNTSSREKRKLVKVKR
jgi:hypothetical protein